MDALPSSGAAAQKVEPWGPSAPANQTNPWGGPAAPASSSDPWPSFGKDPSLDCLCLSLGWLRGTQQGLTSVSPGPGLCGGGAASSGPESDAQQAVNLLLGDRGTELSFFSL